MNSKARKSGKALAALATGTALVFAGVAHSSGSPVATVAAPAKVSADDNFFSPVKVTIAPGGKVKWTNDGKIDHNVTFSGGFASGNFGAGESVVKKFSRAGKFPYTCTLHAGMSGKVKVVGG